MNTTTLPCAVVVHGGAGEPRELDDGCVQAAQRAMDQLEQGRDALDAAVAAVTVLENDGRFNAGTGANLGLTVTPSKWMHRSWIRALAWGPLPACGA